MSRPIIDYFIALAICLVAAGGYRLTVVPWLTPETTPTVAVRDQEKVSNGPDLTGIFPPGSWQLDEPKTLQAEWGTLLFQAWSQARPDQMKVAPVTVILRGNRGGNGAESSGTIIMEAPEGAVIEFMEAPSMLSGSNPEVKGGQLIGDVHIYSMPGTVAAHPHGESSAWQPPQDRQLPYDPQRDAIDLRTSNVRIDNRQIRSADAVDLQLGGARLRGRDLTIHLAGGETISPHADTPLAILDSLELIYLDELSIPLPAGPLWQPLDQPAVTDPALLSIACQGRLVFDFPSFSLRMFEQVEVAHRWRPDAVDTFRCQSLEVQLVDPSLPKSSAASSPFQTASQRTRRATAAEATAAEATAAAGAMEQVSSILRRITAKGWPLVADVPSLDCQLVAGELDVDVTAGRLRLTPSDGPVQVRFRGHALSLPSFEYQLDPQRPTELGTMLCDGAGKLNVDSPDVMLRQLTWQRSIKLLRQDNGHQLWLEGEVAAAMRDGGSAGADKLLLVFQAPPLGTAGNDASQPTESTTESLPTLPGLRLEKLWAEQNVFVDTPQLAANTDNLFVTFEHVPVQRNAGVVSDPAAKEPLGPQLTPASGPRQRQWISGPNGEETLAVQPVARARPTLGGRRINANLVLQGGELISQDVSVEAQVSLAHELNSPTAGRQPLLYTGDTLRLISGAGQERVQITGSPARIELADGYFSGPLVVVDGRQNQVVIRDHGTFQLPSTVVPESNQQSFRWLQPPRCEFRGELKFDGQIVSISDQVYLSGKLATNDTDAVWEITAHAPLLQLQLDQGISVTDPTAAGQTGVEVVSLIGERAPVQIVATQTAPDGQLLARHVLLNRRLDMWAKTSQLQGQGPGWYRAWTPANESSPFRTVVSPGSLMATHLMFNDGLEGDLKSQQLTFFNGVRVGLGTVSNWDQQLDAATMTQLQLNQGTIDCERLRIGASPAPQPAPRFNMSEQTAAGRAPFAWELQADGGVAFRFLTPRGLIDGTAARAAFDSSKDLFVLDGTPSYDAVVRNREVNTGRVLFNVQMQQFTLNAETLEVQALINRANARQPTLQPTR